MVTIFRTLDELVSCDRGTAGESGAAAVGVKFKVSRWR